VKISDLFNLSTVPHHRRKLLYPGLALGVALFFLVLFSSLSGMSASARHKLDTLSERRERILPLVEELRGRQDKGGKSLRPMEPLAAAQQISRDLGMEANLASIRPMNMVGDKEGVQIFFESINLDQLTELLVSLEARAGLTVFSVNLNRRMDNPKLANLQMVLTR
jgi:type II secretory pathway component PulM